MLNLVPRIYCPELRGEDTQVEQSLDVGDLITYCNPHCGFLCFEVFRL
jgi:hypothetical protein